MCVSLHDLHDLIGRSYPRQVQTSLCRIISILYQHDHDHGNDDKPIMMMMIMMMMIMMMIMIMVMMQSICMCPGGQYLSSLVMSLICVICNAQGVNPINRFAWFRSGFQYFYAYASRAAIKL